MSGFPAGCEAADRRLRAGGVRYSVCTLVTRSDEYGRLVESFRAGGFDGADCEYLYLDNSGENRFDAFAGYNLFLTAARGEYVILCHQDVELLEDGRRRLDEVLEALTSRHPDWGLCGNAGGIRPGRLALRISDPHGENVAVGGPFPVRVSSLDENFIVVRRGANLAVSHDLAGFHLYGTDLCLVAGVLGLGAYVVDFHLRHRSPGTADARFDELRRRLIDKYRAALRPRWITTTCTLCFVSGSRLLNAVANSRTGRKIAKHFGKRAR
ncbi:MAG: hypothetical protein WCJ64_00470 [Rhodospirillaceae bacterium]